MVSLPSRIFKRFDIAYNSQKFNPFFLERMAYAQWNNTAPFIRGPFIQGQQEKDEYGYWGVAGEIEHSLRYFMKPHKIIVFGNDVKNTENPYLLTRCWLHATQQENRALVFMERVKFTHPLHLHHYTTAINNNSWLPTDWNAIESATEITQELTRNDKPYQGFYTITMQIRSTHAKMEDILKPTPCSAIRPRH
jgi:hypothetical protein